MQEVNPKDTTRAYAYEMWMKAPMPMVTLIKTLDVTRLRHISRKRGLKFNMLMCWSSNYSADMLSRSPFRKGRVWRYTVSSRVSSLSRRWSADP